MRQQVLERSPNLALVATHGMPEITGLVLRHSLTAEPISGWDLEVVNQQAVDAGTRFVRYNPAIKYPGDINHEDYELRRPAEILELADGRNMILDIHDRPDSNGEYIKIGHRGDTRLLGAAALLGIHNVVMEPGGILPNYNPNAAIIELCRGDTESDGGGRRMKRNVERLRACMRAIAADALPQVDPADFTYYTSVMEIDDSEAHALHLQSNGTQLQPFESIPESMTRSMGLPTGRYVAEYWNGINSAGGGWFGGVLRVVDSPFDLVH